MEDKANNEVEKQPTLSTQDIASAVKIIEVAFQRGAFQASEGKEVGEVYEKLLNFVKYAIDMQQQEDADDKDEENQ